MVTFIEYMTLISLSVGVVIGFLQIRSTVIKSRKESDEIVEEKLKQKTKVITDHIDKKMMNVDTQFKSVDSRFKKDEEDIEDIEDDMKSMVKSFQKMCETLSKHNYIIDEVIPEFKSLQKEFNLFRNAVDVHMAGVDSSVVNNNKPE